MVVVVVGVVVVRVRVRRVTLAVVPSACHGHWRAVVATRTRQGDVEAVGGKVGLRYCVVLCGIHGGRTRANGGNAAPGAVAPIAYHVDAAAVDLC